MLITQTTQSIFSSFRVRIQRDEGDPNGQQGPPRVFRLGEGSWILRTGIVLKPPDFLSLFYLTLLKHVDYLSTDFIVKNS